MYDILVMVILFLWMVTVSWWVGRHFVGPDALYSLLGREGLDSFRASLGDNDTIHQVQWSDPGSEAGDYCDELLYLTTFSLLVLGWLVLILTLLVFLSDKILNKLLCCRLCSGIKDQVDGVRGEEEEEEERVQLRSKQMIEY